MSTRERLGEVQDVPVVLNC